MIILDTDHISALQYREAPQAFALQARLDSLPTEEIVTTAITIEEQTRGWLGLKCSPCYGKSPKVTHCARAAICQGGVHLESFDCRATSFGKGNDVIDFKGKN